MNETLETILKEVLNIIQEYGDQQHEFWQERIIGVDYQPAAEAIVNIIRERYHVKDTNTPSTTN